MAIQAATGEIRDAFFIMLIRHFILVMAGEAIVLFSTRRVALAAVSIGITMIHWEAMVE